MRKKPILLILVIAICLNIAGVHAAYIPGDVLETEFEKDVILLSELGAIDAGEEGLFMPYAKISRAEFAIILQRLIMPEDMGKSTGFKDVADNHYALNAFEYLSRNGYMNGDENGFFKPDDEIKYAEAIKVIVSILGYDKIAEYNGGYPNGYLKIAGDLGILNGVSSDGEYINKGKIAKLITNSFDKNPAQIEMKDGKPIFTFDKKYTMLSAICGIYKMQGIVEANEDYSILGLKSSSKGTLRINAKEFYYDKEDFVGYNVDCYYRINDDDDDVAIAIIPKENENVFNRIESQNIDNAEKFILYYTDETSKTKKIKYNGDTVFIYNNKNKTNFKLEDLNIQDGYLECIDNDDDGTVECIKIFEYYNVVIDFANQEKIVDRFNAGNDISFDDYEKIAITNKAGEKLTAADIKKGMVASVFSSDADGNNVIKIVLSDTTVSGKIESVEKEENITYARIGDKVYTVYQGYRTSSKNSIEYGEEGTYLLDAYKKIVTTTEMSYTDFKIGIVVDCKNYDDSEFGENILDLRIYTQSGRLENVKAIKKLILDGRKYKSVEFSDARDIIKSVSAKPILYKLNNEGILTTIDTVMMGDTNSEKNDKLSEGETVTTAARYKVDTQIFEGKMVVDDKTIVFLIPSNLNNVSETDFKCTGTNYFIGNQSYTGITPYNIEDKIPADIVVLKAETSIINNKSNVALIKSINDVSNEDDETVLNFVVYVNGTEETWQTASLDTLDTVYKIDKYSRGGDTLTALNGQKIQIGDLIKCSFDQRGKINKVAIIYDESENRMVSINPYHDDFHETGNRYVFGKVYNKYDKYVNITYTGTNNVARNEFHNIGKGKVYSIDVKNNQIMEESSIAEIRDEKHNKNGTQIVIISDGGTPKTTYVYR